VTKGNLVTRENASIHSLCLIITGAPASGQTTVGRQLARALGNPYLSKDLLKETLFDTLGWSDRDWSRRLGGASIALLLRSAEALLEVGQSIALESNSSAKRSFHCRAARRDCHSNMHEVEGLECRAWALCELRWSQTVAGNNAAAES
jgi:predicted kinase